MVTITVAALMVSGVKLRMDIWIHDALFDHLRAVLNDYTLQEHLQDLLAVVHEQSFARLHVSPCLPSEHVLAISCLA